QVRGAGRERVRGRDHSTAAPRSIEAGGTMSTKQTGAADPQHDLALERARITVLGYGRAAREHALGLRKKGNEVTIGLRLGGMSWVRARRDGFEAQAPTVLISSADVVVVL